MIGLAATYNPRGEIPRLQRLYPQLKAVYDTIVISLPPGITDDDSAALHSMPGAHLVVNEDWSAGRHMALKTALTTGADHVHYADMDRLLRWVETRPGEWRSTINAVQRSDCLIIGRTETAWATHPQSLRQTEAIYNRFFSWLLGQPLDLSAGSKGFSRRAVEWLMANTFPGRALGADADWVVTLYRSGFKIESVLVDGLDWETADRYQETAVDSEQQRRAAEAYDRDAQNWAMRVGVALEVVESGLDAMQRRLRGGLRYVEVRRHTMRVKPGQHLSQAGVSLARQVGTQIGPFDRVITSTVPRAYETAVAMGFAVDEQVEALAMMLEGVEDEVGSWDAGFGAFAQAVQKGGAAARLGAALAQLFYSVARGLPSGGSALLITHGGMIEAGAVACLPDANHGDWGRYCDYCEGVRLAFDGEQFVDAEILRTGAGRT